MTVEEQRRLYRWFGRLPQATAGVAIVVGVLVLLGWTFKMEVLKTLLPGLSAMKANAAMGFILAGIALWSTQGGMKIEIPRAAGQVCAGLVLLLGLLTLGEYLTGVNFGIDQWVFREITTLPGDIPGRIPPNTVFAFVALGMSLLLLGLNQAGLALAVQVLAVLVIVIAGSAFISYTYDLDDMLREKLNYSPMSLPAALTFVLLAVGVLAARPDYPLRRFMTSDNAAGVMARRMLPAALGLIFVSGWLILQGHMRGYFSEFAALALFAAAGIAGMGALILWYAGVIHAEEAQRTRAEAELRTASHYARNLIESSLDPLVTISAEGKITDVNEATIRATGVPREKLIGSDFSDYFTEPDKASAGYREVFAKGFITDYPLALQHVSGGVMDVLYNASVYRDAKGEVAGIFAAARDITELKGAEKTLRARNLELMKLNTIGVELASIGPGSAMFEFSTSKLKDITGASIATFGEYNPEAHDIRVNYVLTDEDIRDEFESAFAGRKVVETRFPISDDLRIDLTRDPVKLVPTLSQVTFGVVPPAVGERVQAAMGIDRFIGIAYVLDNKLYGTAVLGLRKGIADPSLEIMRLYSNWVALSLKRNRSEEELRAASLYARSLIEASLDPLLTISTEGKITDVNQASVDATGVAREQLIGTDFSDYFTDPEQAREGYKRVLVEGLVRDYPLTIRHISSKTIDVLYNASVYRDPSGKILGVFAAARDVTERKRAEEELHRSEDNFARAFNSNPAALAITSRTGGRFLRINEAYTRMMGYEPAEVIGRTVDDLSIYINQGERDGLMQRLREQGLVRDYELSARAKSGDIRILLLSMDSLLYDNEECILSTFINVTERKRAEEALAANEKKYRALIENAPDGVNLINAEGKVLFTSPACERILGYTPAEVLSIDMAQLTHPDDLPSLLGLLTNLMQQPGAVATTQYRMQHKNGSWRWVESTISNMLAEPSVNAIVFNYRDITERKQAEKALQEEKMMTDSLVDNAPAGIAYLDNEFVLRRYNPYYADFISAHSPFTPDQCIGMSYFDYVPGSRPQLEPIFRKVRDSGQAVKLDSFKLVIERDGRAETSYWDASIAPMRTSDGVVRGILLLAHDVTERERAEEERRATSLYARSLIEASLDPLVTISTEGKVTDVNEATIRATGVSREKLIGSDFSGYFTEPDKARAGYEEVFAKGFVTNYPLALRHASGSVMEVLYNASVYRDDKGEVAGVFAAARNVTELRRAEKNTRERMKELRAFFHLSELAERKDFSLDRLYQELTNALPESWQYSEIAWARIVIGESEFRTANYRATEWIQEAPVTVFDAVSGKIEVGYLEQRPHQDEGPFLKEERQLINAVAERVGHITERKRAEEELRAASHYSRSLIESSLDPLVTISADGKIMDVNEATVQATGVARRKLIASDFSEYFTEPEKARAGYQEVFAKGFVINYPLALKHVSGSAMDVLYNASVYRNGRGEVAGVFAAARDITERKRAEEELRAASRYARNLIEASLDPLVTISADGKITDVNEATIRATGILREKLIGSDFSEYFAEPDKARAGYQEVFAKGFVTDYPLALRHVSGHVMEVLYNASVYRDEKGEVAGVFAAARDVTERMRAEAELHKYHEHLEDLVRQRTGALESANKELEGFAYSVSHDLRTPLRAIDGYSNLLLKRYPDKLDDEGKRYLNVVRDNTRKMAQLIDDILSFSRMGRLGMEVAEVDMEALARAVFEELQPGTAGRELKVEISHLPPCRGDRAMLRQVWLNLLSNAIKFTRGKTPAVVEVGGRTEGAESIYYVKDNGAGFDMQYVEKLFGVFQRLHGVEEFEGTGIGLAIVKRIVTRHGGRVWAEGKVNEGATIYFALPIQGVQTGATVAPVG